MHFILLFLLTVTLTNGEGLNNSALCNGFQANFDLKSVIGSWHVVAIIPEKLFPDKKVTCYRAEIREIDQAGLRWLINKTIETPPKEALMEGINGTIVRQRYHTEHPFDVWSQSVDGVNGCFQQVLSLDLDNHDIHKTLKHDATMQLHLTDADDGSGPFLLQMLWARMVSVVIYRRKQGVTQDQLKTVFELMNKIRGPQRLPKICDNPLRDLKFF